jgi:tetratricopeptide (TPR) repeat protein
MVTAHLSSPGSLPGWYTLAVAVRMMLLFAVLGALLDGQPNPAQVFAEGQSALAKGDLPAAEQAFRKVLALDPRSASAHVNLGVVSMRRKEWQKALTEFSAAERLSSDLPGIKLNIGLAYFRQGSYSRAIPPFESFLQEQPSSSQARELLGLCYFFVDRFTDAAATLEPLWEKRSSDLNYLYVLSVSAGKSSRVELADRAARRLFDVGQGSAEVDLFLARAHLYRNEDTLALEILQRALRKNPRLPYGQYYLGMAYRRLDDLENARTAFAAEVQFQPDAAFAWNQLGIVETKLEHWDAAGQCFRKSIALNPSIASAHLGLAGVYRQAGRLKEALAQLDLALQLDPQSSSVRYQRGRLLLQLNRTQEGQAELKKVQEMVQQANDRVEDEVSGRKLAEPQPPPDNQ